MDLHPNSIESYHEEKDAGKLNLRERLIVEVLTSWDNRTRWNGGLTDREIMKRLGFTDPNMVRPRVTALLDKGTLEECGTDIDRETRKKVRLVRIKKTQEQGELFP